MIKSSFNCSRPCNERFTPLNQTSPEQGPSLQGKNLLCRSKIIFCREGRILSFSSRPRFSRKALLFPRLFPIIPPIFRPVTYVARETGYKVNTSIKVAASYKTNRHFFLLSNCIRRHFECLVYYVHSQMVFCVFCNVQTITGSCIRIHNR